MFQPTAACMRDGKARSPQCDQVLLPIHLHTQVRKTFTHCLRRPSRPSTRSKVSGDRFFIDKRILGAP